MALGVIAAAWPAFALEEPDFPDQNDSLSSDIEPPILSQNSRSNESTLDPQSAPGIESELAKARKRAESADRLFRAGIIARVEAEQRVLRVVQLEAALAEARLNERRKVTAASSRPGNNNEIAKITEEARVARERCDRAELEAATRNLARQKKLLALGSAHRSDVNRAEKKLAELQHPAN